MKLNQCQHILLQLNLLCDILQLVVVQMNFYDRLEELLKKEGVTRKALCTEKEIPYETLNSMIKRESQSIGFDILQKIAEYFHVSTDYLLGRTDVKNPDNEAAVASFGISEESIENIQACSEKALDIDRLLTSPHFKKFVSYLTAYWHCDDEVFLEEHSDSLGIKFKGYDQNKRVFILSRELNAILQQIVEDNRGPHKATQADIDAW